MQFKKVPSYYIFKSNAEQHFIRLDFGSVIRFVIQCQSNYGSSNSLRAFKEIIGKTYNQSALNKIPFHV